MRRWSKSTWVTIVILVLVASCGLFNQLLAGGPYKGRVIDAETKKPLEGAVVLAVWQRVSAGFVQKAYGFLDAEEVLTDSNGRFVVGKHAPASWIPGTWVYGPDIIIFYPGYGFYPRYHVSPPMPLGGTETLLEVMEKKELVIELPPLKTRKERLEVQDGVLSSRIPDYKMPGLIRLVNLERQRLGLDPVHTK
jgi:hypothetical protein